MDLSLKDIIESYNAHAPLNEAWTIPAAWYVDSRITELEARTVFSRTWQAIGRTEQVEKSGQYITWEIAGEPLLVVRASDGVLRGFFNVCRHHAAAVMTQPEGTADRLRCPYHGWTYSLQGELMGTPDFSGVCNFDRSSMGLISVDAEIWEKWVFVRLDCDGPSLESYIGNNLIHLIGLLELHKFSWLERRHYTLECNWKVFVDNYLDGGYHVPHLHRGLGSVLDYGQYTIEPGERFCLQWSPVNTEGAEPQTAAVRGGDRALYYWIYPNFMINWYKGVLDTNLVIPRGVDKTEVVFDFYFTDTSAGSHDRNLASIAIGERIQEEDKAMCELVQRGLASRAYVAGRLSARREAGEHLFHRLLYSDFREGLR